ncbi:MAG: hypothetical protein WC935_10190 [Thermoleophilia bacterium]
MNEADLKRAAFMLAEHTPEYLGKPTMPPQGWRLDGDTLIVLLADGRKIRSPMPHVVERSPILDKLSQAKPVKKQTVAPSITALPVHTPVKKPTGRKV